MQVNVTGHHVELTDAIRDAVNQKCQKIASHYQDLSTVNVILTVDKNLQTAEATTHFLGQDLAAKASAEDLYQAIAEMSSKLQTLLQKRKAVAKSFSHDKPELNEPDVSGDAALAV